MSRPQTPSATHGSTAPVNELDRTAHGAGSRPVSYVGSAVPAENNVDYATGVPRPTSALSQNDDLRPESALSGGDRTSLLQRSNSQMSQSATLPSRGGTLKKKASLRGGALKRSGSRKSSYAGSVRSMKLGEKEKYETEESNSAFYCPVPTSGSPTELLATRFQGM
jgi:hypothetical protein